VHQRFAHTFAAEAVEAPEEYQIELSPTGTVKHLLKFIPISSLAAGVVNMFAND
jgi:hypothetical protein